MAMVGADGTVVPMDASGTAVGFVDNNVTGTVPAGIVVERLVRALATEAPVVE